MRKIIIIAVIIVIFAGWGFLLSGRLIPTKPIHFHAGFQVYKEGVLQDFSNQKYMHEKPCTLNGASSGPVDEQIEKAHLHDFVGDVVHVHRVNATWGDLFKNLNYHVPSTIDAYVNGIKVQNVLSSPIHPYDSLVLLIGKHGDISGYLAKAVTKKYILAAEKHSENCATP